MSTSVATDPGARPEDVGTRVSRGLGWSLAGQLLSRFGIFASGIALARLLAPEDFGQIAAALVLVNVAMSANELGLIPAIVRWRGDIRPAAATATTIAITSSVAMYAVVFAIAPYVGDVMNTPGSAGVTRIMALCIVVDGVVAVPLAMLNRQFRVTAQVGAELLGTVTYVATAIGLAVAIADASAVAWGRFLGAVVTAAVMVSVSRWPARPSFDIRIARELLAFGIPLVFSMGIFELVMNVDYVIVGRELDAAALGVYLLAFNLSNWPVSILSGAIERVSFAGYSALADDRDRLARGFVQSIAVALSATCALVAVLAVLAPEVVGIVYGEQWAGAVGPVRWLLVVGGLRVVLQLSAELLAAAGRPGRTFWIRLAWLAVLPVALDQGAARGGLSGVGIAHVVVVLAVVLPLVLHSLAGVGVRPSALVRCAARPAVATAVAVAVMVLVGGAVHGDLLRLVVLGALGTAAYVIVLVPHNPVLVTTLAQLRGDRVSVVT